MTLTAAFTDALAIVAQGAAARDREPHPAFPDDAIGALEQAGVLVAGLPFSEQLTVVRDVARADAAVARIVDGHLNAVERLAVHAEDPLRERELTAVAEERLRLGVWGADPRPGEGEPARIRDGGLHGVKTFCSGAGGLQRAIVLAGDRLAYVDLTEGTLVDPGLVRGRRDARLRQPSRRLRRRAGARRPGRARARSRRSRGSRATRCAPRPPGPARPTPPPTRRCACSPRGPSRPSSSASPPAASGPSRARSGCGSPRAGAGATPAPLRREDGAYLRHVDRRRATSRAARRGGARLRLAPVRDRRRRWTARAATSSSSLLQHRLDPIVARAGAAALEEAPVSVDPATFERMYRDDEDPWGFGTSPVRGGEVRPDDRGARRPAASSRALELGCSIGVLTARLRRALRRADRAGRRRRPRSSAGARARRRPHADVRVATLPEELPGGRFDLVVASEVLYYFAPDVLDGAARRPRGRAGRPAACCSPSTGGRRRGRTRCAATRSTTILAARPGLRGIHAEPHDRYRLDVLERT